MKEVTEWNGKPRNMWCWDFDENDKVIEYVVCILTKEQMDESTMTYPVRTTGTNNKYLHCAEIEEEKRPCTREELLEMLKKQGLPMLYRNQCSVVYTILLIKDEDIVLLSALDDSLIHYDYSELCSDFTLLDGTELWVEE